MRFNDQQSPSSAVVLSVIQGQPIGLSAKSNQGQPEKWGWGYALLVMVVTSAACWVGFGAIILI